MGTDRLKGSGVSERSHEKRSLAMSVAKYVHLASHFKYTDAMNVYKSTIYTPTVPTALYISFVNDIRLFVLFIKNVRCPGSIPSTGLLCAVLEYKRYSS